MTARDRPPWQSLNSISERQSLSSISEREGHSEISFKVNLSVWGLEKESNTEFPLSSRACVLTSRSRFSFSRIKLSEDLLLEEKLMGQNRTWVMSESIQKAEFSLSR